MKTVRAAASGWADRPGPPLGELHPPPAGRTNAVGIIRAAPDGLPRRSSPPLPNRYKARLGGQRRYANAGNRTLIEAIAKGRRWQEQIESSEYASLEDLAHAVGSSRRSRQAKTGVDRTYVGRMLRLTSLAPDIIEAILRGDEPDDLSLEKLRKNLPVRWDDQRKSLSH